MGSVRKNGHRVRSEATDDFYDHEEEADDYDDGQLAESLVALFYFFLEIWVRLEEADVV